MDSEAVTMLQRAADIMKDDFGALEPETIAAFLYIASQERTTIHQLATALHLQAGDAARIAIELSSHSGGVGLVEVAFEGDLHRVIAVNDKAVNFANRLGYVLRN